MSADDRRAALLRVGTETTAEIEATLRSARGPFLAGDAPGAADCSLAATLWVAHNLLASGTALCYAKAHARGSAACSFAQIGGPSVERYLAAWARRPSWRAALRTDAVNSAAAIRPIVDSLVDAAGDVCSGETMLECMTRVRAADDYYNAAVRAERHNVPAVPPPELRPRRVRVGVDALEPTRYGRRDPKFARFPNRDGRVSNRNERFQHLRSMFRHLRSTFRHPRRRWRVPLRAPVPRLGIRRNA